ncbi:MAG: DUF429 domain-containing protein [Acidobacteriota bacterium]|nr:DUF429 domain-containing protein [Acidobacteriota bacterium]
MAWVSGVDGCSSGWVVVDAFFEENCITRIKTRLARTMDEVLDGEPTPQRVALDIPVGLLEERRRGGRVCDQLTRKHLPGRTSSVFSPPVRPLLSAVSWEEARTGGISIQAFHIMGKIAQVDAWMTPERQQTVFESHPELAFAVLAGRPMQYNKKKAPGRAERLAVLAGFFPGAEDWLSQRHYLRKDVALDDLIDACVLTRVAWSHLEGNARCLPPEPPRDARGLEMTIWMPPL